MAIELFDTHCHLTFADLDQRCDQVVADAFTAGVTRLITVAGGAEEAIRALDITDRHENVWIAAGIHPHDAVRANEDDLHGLAELWRRGGRIVAAGEMGLDYHYDFSPRDVQCVILERQLELAARLDLPVVIHARKAHEEIVRILTKHAFVGRKVVFHCYSGTPRQAAELRANGWRTSFTGILTFEKADDMRQVLMEAPADQLMFETDAPYLSPEPVRKIRPNEPKNLVHTLSFAAKLRGMALEDLARLSTSNAIQFFGLPLQRTGQ